MFSELIHVDLLCTQYLVCIIYLKKEYKDMGMGGFFLRGMKIPEKSECYNA